MWTDADGIFMYTVRVYMNSGKSAFHVMLNAQRVRVASLRFFRAKVIDAP